MSPEVPLLPLESIVELLRSGIPDAEWLLGEIESQQGWFRFPTSISRAISNLRLESYPLLYVSEAAIGAAMFRVAVTPEQIKQLGEDIDAASLEQRAEIFGQSFAFLDEMCEGFQIPKTRKDQEAAESAFRALSPEDQKEAVKASQHFFLGFIPSFYQWLSVMVHGEKLTSLVAQAQAGKDDAFVKAVQIDRRILTEMPYFKARYARAQDEADSDFSDKLAYRLQSPPYRGKIRHKSLWLTFAMLEQVGWLGNLGSREILDICDEAGVGGYENRIQSEKHLANRVREYREFQKRGIVTTT